MRTSSKLFMTGLIALGMISCNKENSSINGGNDNQEQIYMQLSIEMPQTKSATDGTGDSNSDANKDTEEGTAAESAIKTVKMYLLNPEDKTVVAESVTDPASFVKAGSMVTVPFRAQDLVKYVRSKKYDIEAVIYVNCEPTTKPELGKALPVDEVYEVADIANMTTNGFFMTNANRDHITTTLPAIDVLLTYDSEKNPFTINPLDVERSAARFDVAAAAKDNKFEVKQGKEPALNVVFDEVGLFNMSKKFYRLRRVSNDGENPSFAEVANYVNLFGIETPANYVVDIDEKNEDFMYAAAPEWTALTTIANGTADQWTGNTDPHKDLDYRVWRYVTENTNNTDTVHQNRVTGVAYKAHIEAIEGVTESTLAEEIKAGQKTLYTFNNVLWGSADRIKTQATKEGYYDQTLVDAYKFAMNLYNDANWNNGKEPEVRMDLALKETGFIAYPARGGKYEVYYNYYNRHNDKLLKENDPQGAPDVKAPMYYGVVRNNVYKLRVNSVSKLGTPDWQKPEPKPIDDENVYFQVTVTILPWTVRVNDIEF